MELGTRLAISLDYTLVEKQGYIHSLVVQCMLYTYLIIAPKTTLWCRR